MIHTLMQLYPPALRMRILALSNQGTFTRENWTQEMSPAMVSVVRDVAALHKKIGMYIGASMTTIAAWTRYGCSIYDCSEIIGPVGGRLMDDVYAHDNNPPAAAAALVAEWRTIAGISAPSSGCEVYSFGAGGGRGMWGAWDVSDCTYGAARPETLKRVRRYADVLRRHQRRHPELTYPGSSVGDENWPPSKVAVIESMSFIWGSERDMWGWQIPEADGSIGDAVLQVDVEGLDRDGVPFWLGVGISASGRFIITNMDGKTVHDLGLGAFIVLYALTVAIGLHSKAVTYYTPKRRKGQKRRGRGGKGRTTVRTCKLDTERWRRRERKPGLTLLPTKRKPAEPGHVPVPYAGAGYHVGRFTRGTWVREESVREGEEWLDIKESKRGGLLVKVARECNADGYTVGTPKPKLVLVQPA